MVKLQRYVMQVEPTVQARFRFGMVKLQQGAVSDVDGFHERFRFGMVKLQPCFRAKCRSA